MFNFNVRGRRVGRIAFGWVLISGVPVLVSHVCERAPTHALRVLAATWGAAFVAYAIAGSLGSRRPISRPDQLARLGLVVPSVGAALLLPLTIQAPVLLALGVDFDDWVMYALVATSGVHLVFAWLAGVRARALADGVPAPSPWVIFGACVGTSCVPFILLAAVPPILVALTGVPLVALMRASERLAANDRRRALEEARATLPGAIARVHRKTA